MRYLLDTNAIIALLNDSRSKLAKRARRERPTDIGLSAVVAHELYFGAYKSRRSAENVGLINALQFPVLDFDKDDARAAGEIRGLLSAKGTPIGPYDALIAGQALARELILVSHNTKELARVTGLQLDDWLA